ncbi:MAG TPA: hypothetical protein VKX49_12645 [Bryobacteraceae bacterium]|nr:hypothetical protein [Bryobacteraceae bacterium]
MADKKNFIQSAIKHPGRLTNAAHRAGESVSEYAKEHEHDPKGTIGDAARLYNHVLGGQGHKPKGEKHSSDGKGHYSGH